jgi:tetratricopeptide (TPR) repeat protein
MDDDSSKRRKTAVRRRFACSISALAVILLVWPLSFRFAGDRIARRIVAGQKESVDRSAFSTAERLYLLGMVSPLFWQSLRDRRENIRYKLSGGYGHRLFFGLDGPEVAEAHLDFLGSIDDAPRWRAEHVRTLARYGRYEEALRTAWGSSDGAELAEAATAAAIAAGDAHELEIWVDRMDWRNDPHAFRARALLLAHRHERLADWLARHGESDEMVPVMEAELLRRRGRSHQARTSMRKYLEHSAVYEVEAEQILALSIDEDGDEEAVEYLSRRLSEDEVGADRLCAWAMLAASERERGRPNRALEAVMRAVESGARTLDIYFPLYRLPSHWFMGCHPRFLDVAERIVAGEIARIERARLQEPQADTTGGDVSPEPATEDARMVRLRGSLAALHLYEAMIWISLFAADEAEACVGEAEVVSPESPLADYLRVLTCEVRGDYAAAREIVKARMDDTPQLSRHLRARLALEGRDVERAREIMQDDAWDPQAVPSLVQEAAVMRHVAGLPSDGTISAAVPDLPGESFESDVQARRWLTTFAGHPASPRLSHGLLVPLMYRWEGAPREGGFWIAYHRHEGSSPTGALVRAHMGYLAARAAGDDERAEVLWSRMEGVREMILGHPVRSVIECEISL